MQGSQLRRSAVCFFFCMYQAGYSEKYHFTILPSPPLLTLRKIHHSSDQAQHTSRDHLRPPKPSSSTPSSSGAFDTAYTPSSQTIDEKHHVQTTMLLPSALSCDSGLHNPRPQRPQRPKLQSFDRYDPRQRSQSPVVGLIASCRALHSMLGERFSPAPSPSLESTIRARPLGSSPFGAPTPPPVCPPAPRGKNKRTRDEWDDEDSDESMDMDAQSMSSHSDGFSTPKRQRRVPLELPPGLLAADFEALYAPTTERPPSIRRRTSAEDIDMPYSSPPPLSARLTSIPEDKSVSTWTENDDRVLVETVLSKLSLSAREWNDCAVQLGKDKDSLGRRWRLLLGEGNIGLRRGVGRMERADLDIKSW